MPARALRPSPPHARFTIRRRIHHPPPAAYAWLTDFDERDAERAGAIVRERRVVERDGTRLRLEGHLEVAGRGIPSRATVDLAPPDRWHAKLYDKRGRLYMFNDYVVEPDGTGGTRLVVDYHLVLPTLRHRLRYHLGGKLVLRREITRMWEGFEAAMDRELGAAPAR